MSPQRKTISPRGISNLARVIAYFMGNRERTPGGERITLFSSPEMSRFAKALTGGPEIIDLAKGNVSPGNLIEAAGLAADLGIPGPPIAAPILGAFAPIARKAKVAMRKIHDINGTGSLFHQTDVQTAVDMLTSSREIDGVFVSPFREYALSPNPSRTALVEMDRALVDSIPSRSKPGLAAVEQNVGEPIERTLYRANSPTPITAIEIAPQELSRVSRGRLDIGVRRGSLTKIDLPDGRIRFERVAKDQNK